MDKKTREIVNEEGKISTFGYIQSEAARIKTRGDILKCLFVLHVQCFHCWLRVLRYYHSLSFSRILGVTFLTSFDGDFNNS